MKLTFSNDAMGWMHDTVNKIIYIAHKHGAEEMGRTARKMRYKFHGNPPVVFLTAKERALLKEAAEYRMASVINEPTDERIILASVLEVLRES